MQKEEFCHTVRRVISELLTGISSRMVKLGTSKSLQLATLLDPRVKSAQFANKLSA